MSYAAGVLGANQLVNSYTFLVSFLPPFSPVQRVGIHKFSSTNKVKTKGVILPENSVPQRN
jgi:hypothetical protein